jgi:hypothetical protein
MNIIWIGPLALWIVFATTILERAIELHPCGAGWLSGFIGACALVTTVAATLAVREAK